MKSEPRLTRRDLVKVLAAGAVGLPLESSLRGPGRIFAEEPPVAELPKSREIEQVLWRRVLDAWYPRCLDTTAGGFHENFAEDWSQLPSDSRFIVFQARMTWTPAAVALHYPRQRRRMLTYVRHGLKYLTERMWDGQHGGFFERIDLQGRPHADWLPWKQMYGQAFGIYAAAGAYKATGDQRALDLAIKGFRWIERVAHDAECGGYFEMVTRKGRPLALIPADEIPEGRSPIIGRLGQKSMNAHIHILEALTELRKVWDDPLLRERLREVFLIVRDKIVCEGGHLSMFATRDFKPLDERSSFGHELETAYLLIEAEEVMGQHQQQTRQAARKLVDHSLRFGWDQKHGGFFDEGPPQAPPVHRNKVWWAQPEGLNGLLTADGLFGQQDPRYLDIFARNWAFFRDRFIDPRHGGCYGAVDESGEPTADGRSKASPWKAAYHVVRGLLFAVSELRRREKALGGA